VTVQKALDERGLPNPCLAAHQRQPTRAIDCVAEEVIHDVQRGLALDKLHQREIMPFAEPRSKVAASAEYE
jgi:hypothetical protein